VNNFNNSSYTPVNAVLRSRQFIRGVLQLTTHKNGDSVKKILIHKFGL